MTLDLVTMVFVSFFIAIFLIVLFFMLALRYDQVISVAGPRITKTEIEAQIESKRQELADYEKRLEDWSERLKNIAELEAEVDALARQRDELLIEHNSLSDRKEEVRQMDRETEDAIQRFGEAKHDLNEKEEALLSVQTKLDRAEALVSEFNRLQNQEKNLRAKVESSRTELFDLHLLKQEEVNLRTAVKDLRREIARLEGGTTAATERLHSVRADLAAAENKSSEAQILFTEALTRNEVIASEAQRLEAENEGLEAKARRLEARIALRQDESDDEGDGASKDEQILSDLRVPPACLYDEKNAQPIWPTEQAVEAEGAALDRVEQLLCKSGMVFSRRTINAFHTSLKTAVISPLTVLAGISGTGKSQLPLRYADAMGMHFLKIPVQPRWDGPQDLFGFYNYIEKRYKATDIARALVHMDSYNWPEDAKPFEDRVLLILLDEMNLARVEYYFSEFLSRLEGRPPDDGAASDFGRRPSEIDIDVGRKGRPMRVYAGQNILFVGTMNEDESTQALSDKVVDRANILRFSRPSQLRDQLPNIGESGRASGYLSKARWTRSWMREADSLDATERSRAADLIEKINAEMDNLGRPFGHRMSQAMLHYIANYPNAGSATQNSDAVDLGLADQIEQRILPKLRGLDVASEPHALQKLADIAGTDLRDTELGEAIELAIHRSASSIGIFNWRGLHREIP